MSPFNHEILSADAYNALPLLNEQPSVTSEDLVVITSLFIRHDAHRHFAAGLLHRHITLSPDHIMVHHHLSNHSECTVAPAGPSAVPHSFYLSESCSFQAFEYQEFPYQSISLPHAFAEDLRQELLSRQLCSVLSIVPRTADLAVIKYETLLQDNKGMNTQASDSRSPAEGEEHISTTWVFSQGDDGSAIITGAKKCIKMINAVHEVRKD
ncbi:Hypothetical protein D9617_9g024780 [Elsinoe fawcettii]|nr:Hypothetical protein D9617_9g024780 [Elsinoe fawcettii]